MKKVLIAFIALLLLVAGILFTPFGRSWVLVPLANSYLHYAIADHDVKLQSLEPRLKGLRLSGIADQTIHFEADGAVNWLSLNFDLPYRLWAKRVIVAKSSYPIALNVKGDLRGTPQKMIVSGSGVGFEAKLRYLLEIRNSKVQGVKIDAQGAKVSQILALAKRSPFATGLLDLSIQIPDLSSAKQRGGIDFKVRNGQIDAKLLKKEFGLTIPPVKKYTLEGRLLMRGELFEGKATFHSGLLDLNLNKFYSDRTLNIFKANYDLNISELSYLASLTRRKLYGPWNMSGSFYLNRKDQRIQIDGKSSTLKGESRFFYDKGLLDLSLKDVSLPLLMRFLGEAPLLKSGKINTTAHFQNIKSLEGSYTLKADGVWNRKEIIKLLKSDPGEKLSFSIKSQGTFRGNLLHASADYRSPLLNLVLSDLKYEWISGAMEARYRLGFPDLRRLRLFAKAQRSYGANLRGELSYLPVRRLLRIKGKSSSFGGQIRFSYSGKSIKLWFRDADAKKMAELFGMPRLWRVAKLNGVVTMRDLLKRVGVYSINLNAIIDPAALNRLYGIRLLHPLPIKLSALGELKGSFLTLKSDLESRWGRLKLQKATYAFNSGTFKALYILNIPELSRLKPLTGASYRGPLKLAGRIERSNSLLVTGGANQWGGRIDYTLKGELLRLLAKGVEIGEVMKSLELSTWLKGKAKSDLRYNIQSKRGTLKVESNAIYLVQSPLIQTLSTLLNSDLSQEIFSNAILSAQIEPQNVIFNFHATSRRFKLEIKGGKIDRIKQSIDALLTIYDRDKRYKVRIKGPLKHPKFLPVITKALRHKVIKTLKKPNVQREIKHIINKAPKLIRKLF